ncbi:VOC family protein [Hydrocarboniphaga effusa]|jgi:PhnB protein|uniref:VOC family protein n=1 Tax=Hydrocarboniphaga effusa TaxID=243629 RepID=UPI003137947D
MKLNTYLSFDGNCREAFEFYAQALGAKITAMMSFGETPASEYVSEASRSKIMHACLDVDGHNIMGTDGTPEHPHVPVQGAHVVADVATPAEAERVFAALSPGAQIQMPLAETFWAQRYGQLVDRYGVAWMVNCSQPLPGCAVESSG